MFASIPSSHMDSDFISGVNGAGGIKIGGITAAVFTKLAALMTMVRKLCCYCCYLSC